MHDLAFVYFLQGGGGNQTLLPQCFLNDNANDPLMLPARLLLLIGYNTRCRCQALYNLAFRHIQMTSDGDLRITIDFAHKHDQAASRQSWLINKNPSNPNICVTTLFNQYRSIASKAGMAEGWLWNKLYKVRGELKMKKQWLGENWVSGLP
jgi:hypothetical protein